VLFLPIQVHSCEFFYPQDFQSWFFCRTIAKPVHKLTKEKLTHYYIKMAFMRCDIFEQLFNLLTSDLNLNNIQN
jgi:hypothetical protein